jgi:omega-hydroxy-beta-dihydromenaquinone-9 sulfotransferase
MYGIGAFFYYNYLAFFRARGTHYRLTPKRIFALTVFLLIFLPSEILNWIGFGLDEIFFPKYRQQVVKTPVFIIGNPRSGTTFTHRLLEKDTDTFTTTTSWELLFAPSITQRKIIWLLRDLLDLLKVPFKRTLDDINESISMDKSAHKIRLNGSEEDEHFLIHIWASAVLWPIYPIKDTTLPHFFFDKMIPHDNRLKIIGFYKNMLQRHIYAYGGDKILLSKNPSFSGKIDTLLEVFPDARFIDLVRNPFECMPSMMNYMASGWKVFGSPLEPYPYKEEFFEVMNHYYLYPAEYFQDKEEVCTFVKYDELLADTDEVIIDLYQWMNLPLSEKFEAILEQETSQQRTYRSKHAYDLTEMGLTEEMIFSAFSEVFQYYEFESHEFELPERPAWQRKGWRQNWKKRRLLRREKRQLRRQKRRSRRKNIPPAPPATIQPK